MFSNFFSENGPFMR